MSWVSMLEIVYRIEYDNHINGWYGSTIWPTLPEALAGQCSYADHEIAEIGRRWGAMHEARSAADIKKG